MYSNYTYIYIYIRAVNQLKYQRNLTQEKNIFQINALKIFNAINAVAGLGLDTPFTTPASVSFFLKGIAFI